MTQNISENNCFNSTLVQLKVALPTYSGAIFPLFQFYLSSIKRNYTNTVTASDFSFNSTLVQLKVVRQVYDTEINHVSILP